MRMLRWKSGNTLRDSSRWFDHVYKRFINRRGRRIACLEVTGFSRGRGKLDSNSSNDFK